MNVPAPVLSSLELLQSYCAQAHFGPGAVLRQKGQFYRDMYLITSGSVEVDLGLRNAAGAIVVSGSNLPIGEIAFLRGCEATATVTAATATSALTIDDAVLARLEREQPQLCAQLMRYLAQTAEDRTSSNLVYAVAAPGPARAKNIEIYLCRNAEMLEGAQRLRYEVYCGELRRNSPYADHGKRIIADALDDFGHTFIAVEDGEIVGTLRANFSPDGPLGALEEIYGMTASPHHPAATGICTKLVVKKSKRGGPAAMKMIAGVVRYGLRRQTKECYIDCVPSLLHYYKAIGFTISGQKFFHRENGLSQPMVLDLVRHGERLSHDQGPRQYLKLFAKAQMIRMLDIFRAKTSRAGRQ